MNIMALDLHRFSEALGTAAFVTCFYLILLNYQIYISGSRKQYR